MTNKNVSPIFKEHSEIDEVFERLRKGHDGGDGGGGSMDERVTAIEKRMDRVENKLDRISETVARIDAKLDSKVDYKWLTIYVLGIAAVVLRSEIASLFSGTPTP